MSNRPEDFGLQLWSNEDGLMTINVIDNPGARCECVTDHNPNAVQLHVHHILPLSWGGAKEKANELLICPTTHDNVHRLLREYKKANGRPSWNVEKYFGVHARELAAEGWKRFQEVSGS